MSRYDIGDTAIFYSDFLFFFLDNEEAYDYDYIIMIWKKVEDSGTMMLVGMMV